MSSALQVLLIILACSFNTMAQSMQEFNAKNIVFFEGLGAGGYGSLNYERILIQKNRFAVGARLGFGLYRIKDYRSKVNPDITLPIAVSVLYGKKHFCEISLGNTFSSIVKANPANGDPIRKNGNSAIPAIGYRYQRADGGIMFRATYTPIFEYYSEFLHWTGFSLGYSF